MPASKAGALPLGDAPTRNFVLHVVRNTHQHRRPYSVSQNERNRRFTAFMPKSLNDKSAAEGWRGIFCASEERLPP
jgi:hypothetical protein